MTYLSFRTFFLVAGLILCFPQLAMAGLQLDDTIYEWGEIVKYSYSVGGVYDPRIEVRPRFVSVTGPEVIWEDSIVIRKEPRQVPGVVNSLERRTFSEEGELDTRDFLVGSRLLTDPSRSFYDVVLMTTLDGKTYKDVDRKTILVLRKINLLPEEEVSWTFPENAKLLPNAEIGFSMSSAPDRRNYDGPSRLEGPPRLRLIRHGRFFPGGAIEPDQIAMFERSSRGKGAISVKSGGFGFGSQPHLVRQPVPKNIVVTSSSDTEILSRSGIQFTSPETSTLPDLLRLLDGAYGTPEGGLSMVLSAPFVIGTYEAQILGVGDAIIASRRFDVVLPNLKGALSVDSPSDKPLAKPPNIVVKLPPSIHIDGFGRLVSLAVTRDGRKGEMIETFAFRGSLANAKKSGQNYTFEQTGPWQPGTYTVSLYFGTQHILLDRLQFEIKKDRRVKIIWPSSQEPLIDPEEVEFELPNQPVVVFGPKIPVKIKHINDKRPLDGGPFIAELYKNGHYTYGCFWREGYYTGAAAYLSDDGTGLISAPGETGEYEIRIFRPMNELPVKGKTPIQKLRIARPNPGKPWSPNTMELVGSAPLFAELPEIQVIQVDPYAPTDLHKSLTFTVLDPGPDFEGHVLQLHLWRKPGELHGGLKSVSTPTGIAMKDANGASSGAPTLRTFPATFTLEPFNSPGNFELRLLDVTSGAFIAKRDIRLRDPLAFGGFPSIVLEDWPSDLDGTRGVEAWMPPKDACVDPVFDKPPVLELVEYWRHDPTTTEDDEYIKAPQIWPGYPYLVQARFEQAPADEIYRVKVDGERRVRIYRTEDDPHIYRSEVITFVQEAETTGESQ